ncbi:MAG: hypothetical protein U5K54_05145 [Cytophagales bacterium]|nr:hypothetical protein [Cytophagales bacterium]
MAPTADCRVTWQASMEHIACEGRCFVLGCNPYLTKEHYPKDLQALLADGHPSLPSSGGSCLYIPSGKKTRWPLIRQRGILTAKYDHREIIKAKMDFDPIGHYARNDVFELKIKKEF